MTDIHDCIERLAANDEADRIYAAEDIGYANEPEGIEPLFRRLPMEPSRAVREAILAALIQIEGDAVIDGALELLDSDDSFLRNQAVQLLQSRGRDAVPRLLAAFANGGHDRRKFVVDVVSRFTGCEILELYRRALQDADRNVVITAVESIGSSRRVELRKDIEDLISPAAHPMLLCACLETLSLVGDGGSLAVVRNRLGTAAKTPAYLQAAYIKLLGAAGSPDDLPEIADLIATKPLLPAVLNALLRLRNRYPERVLPSSLAEPLIAAAAKKQTPLSYYALRLLSGLVHDERVFAFLAGCLEISDKVVRIGAIQALRENGGDRAESVLRERLANESDNEVLQVWGGKGA